MAPSIIIAQKHEQNHTFKHEITALLEGKASATIREDREITIKPHTESDFQTIIVFFSANDFALVSLFCVEKMDKADFSLLYVFERKGHSQTVVVHRAVDAATPVTSIAEQFPSASWYEREVRDGFGIEFSNAFDKRRLFLHETFPEDFHPLLKSFKNRKVATKKSPQATYPFKEVKGEGVYHIPVGPVHAGIIEPGHFRFSVIGETIFNLEVRMFYKHRGVEKTAEAKSAEECLPVVECISGDETVANAVGFSLAVEGIGDIAVPSRAKYLRTILLEMERIYSHLGDLAGMIIDVAYPMGASPFFILREEIFRANELLTGSRFMRGIIAVGGLTKNIPEDALLNLVNNLKAFSPRFKKAVGDVLTSSSVIDRLETTGRVKESLVGPLHLTGPVARACGFTADTRRDHPYGLYDKLLIRDKNIGGGDVLGRFKVKAAEINESVELIKSLISGLPRGDVLAKYSLPKEGHALALVEAPRGQNMHWVCLRDGTVYRYKVRTASFCNWQAIEHAVLGNIVPDFPLINKSMNLSYAGTDL